MPLNPTDLLQIRSLLDLSAVSDTQFWAAILYCFFGLLRISNVTAATSQGDSKCIARNDFTVTVQGIIPQVRKTKTIQFQEWSALPFLKNHPLGPT